MVPAQGFTEIESLNSKYMRSTLDYNSQLANHICLLLSLILSFNLSAQNIYRSVCQGNLARLDSLLQETPINTQDNRGRSLLHWAVACKQQAVFDSLIKRGIHINMEDQERRTPMYMAVRFEQESYFDQLLALQRDDSWIAKQGGAMMEKAVLNNSQNFLAKLLESGVNIDALNSKGSTPLETARRLHNTEIVEWLVSKGADESKVRTFVLKGDYMGQSHPKLVPKVFAPNFISTEEYEFGSVFNAAGTEFFWGVDVGSRSEIRYSKLIDGVWTQVEIILSHERYGYNDPFLSPDEQRLYFISKHAMDGKGELKDYDIWYVERTSGSWSEPINAGANINSQGDEYYISFTADGTMYFASNKDTLEEENINHDIYYSKFVDGTFQTAVALSDAINTDAYEADVFVAPDESYLIFCSTRSDALGRGDLYISFKNETGTWSKAKNMGAPINTVHHELCPFVSLDGKYLFYTSNEDIYWVSTNVIEQLRD